jgi:hypothetical protein
MESRDAITWSSTSESPRSSYTVSMNVIRVRKVIVASKSSFSIDWLLFERQDLLYHQLSSKPHFEPICAWENGPQSCLNQPLANWRWAIMEMAQSRKGCLLTWLTISRSMIQESTKNFKPRAHYWRSPICNRAGLSSTACICYLACCLAVICCLQAPSKASANVSHSYELSVPQRSRSRPGVIS